MALNDSSRPTSRRTGARKLRSDESTKLTLRIQSSSSSSSSFSSFSSRSLESRELDNKEEKEEEERQGKGDDSGREEEREEGSNEKGKGVELLSPSVILRNLDSACGRRIIMSGEYAKKRRGESMPILEPAHGDDNDDDRDGNDDEDDNNDDDDDDEDDFSDDDDDLVYENPIDVVLEAQEAEKKRQQVVRELLHSEQTYLEKLNFLRKIKCQLEAMNSVKQIFPPDDPDRMFPCVEELVKFHTIIKISLEQILQNWKPQSTIGGILTPRLDELRIYADFIKAYPLAINTLEMWKAKEERFSRMLVIFQQHSSVSVLGLSDVMHEPYIRLQRWKLLLLRYKKYLISSADREHKNIERVLTAVESILRECESFLQTADNLDVLLKFVDRIDGILAHFASDTRLIKEGSAIEVDPRGKHIGKKALNKLETPLHLLLFNNFLLICTPYEPNKKQMICGKIKLSALQVLTADFLTSMGYEADQCLTIQTEKKALLLAFPSSKEAFQWKQLIQETCVKASSRPSFKAMMMSNFDFSCAPVWIPDDCVTSCALCFQTFNLIRRRHHCRGCGIVICSDCSAGKIKLPYQNMSPGLVCRTCYKRAKKLQPDLIISGDRDTDIDILKENTFAKHNSLPVTLTIGGYESNDCNDETI